MFLPTGEQSSAANSEQDREAQLRKRYAALENVILDRINPAHRSAAEVHVQEVQCGDPSCAPIDTVCMIMFESGGRGQFGMPFECHEVNDEILDEFCPPSEILQSWYEGSKVEWSPFGDEDDVEDMGPDSDVKLRFDVGSRVQCRTGADPVTGWATGSVIQLWYREANWPPGQLAPYKIKLDDGRNIFAPADQPEIIRAAQV
jgi:hypothetical protein